MATHFSDAPPYRFSPHTHHSSDSIRQRRPCCSGSARDSGSSSHFTVDMRVRDYELDQYGVSICWSLSPPCKFADVVHALVAPSHAGVVKCRRLTCGLVRHAGRQQRRVSSGMCAADLLTTHELLSTLLADLPTFLRRSYANYLQHGVCLHGTACHSAAPDRACNQCAHHDPCRPAANKCHLLVEIHAHCSAARVPGEQRGAAGRDRTAGRGASSVRAEHAVCGAAAVLRSLQGELKHENRPATQRADVIHFPHKIEAG